MVSSSNCVSSVLGFGQCLGCVYMKIWVYFGCSAGVNFWGTPLNW